MLTIGTRLAWIVTQLRNALGAFAMRESRVQPAVWLGTRLFAPVPPPNPLPKLSGDVWRLFWDRIGRLSTRFETLFTRWRENRLPARRAPRPHRSRVPAKPLPRLPRAHGWVLRRVRESGSPAGQLADMLADPETRAFVAAAPQAGRLLRPLCRALAIPQPDWLRLPRRPRPPRPPRAPRPRPPALTDPTLHLPRNVIAAARAWNKNRAERSRGRLPPTSLR
jgi:hypothetical protein